MEEYPERPEDEEEDFEEREEAAGAPIEVEDTEETAEGTNPEEEDSKIASTPMEGMEKTPEEDASAKHRGYKTLVQTPIEDEMKKSYLDYSMSVIVGRALPDVRDGLKPVHRRILYAMNDMGMHYNKAYKKSARVVGEVLGKYHPHGDTAVYDSMVRMVQDFSLRYPLLDGQGNFGSIDGDSAAAMRYCVTGDMKVATSRGLIRIDELSDKEDISIEVLSKDGIVNHASKWFDSGRHPTKKLTTERGYSISGSYNHPLLTLTKDRITGRPKFFWKTIENIKEGDFLVLDRSTDNLWPTRELDLTSFYPVKGSRRKGHILPESLNEDLAFILGSLVSEGSISEKKIEFCNSDREWITEFKTRWARVFPDSTLHHFDKKPSSYGKLHYTRLECHCKNTLEFLRNIGLDAVRSKAKKIPHVILKSPKNTVAMFLRAYFEGDGTITTSTQKMIELGCCSSSEELVKDIQVLLLRFGIASNKRFDRHRSMHKLYIRGKSDMLRFYKEIGFLYERKKGRLEYTLLNYKKDFSQTDFVPFLSEYIRGLTDSRFLMRNNFDRYPNMQKHHATVNNVLLNETFTDYSLLFEYLLGTHYLFQKVINIEENGIKNVYSIRVDSDCHSFVANGFINHNTEIRMARISEEMLTDIDKETVDFTPNFDESLQEPTVLPAKIPNLLINGSSGIAVGMAANIPPHNLAEVVDGVVAVIDDPNIEDIDLMQFVKGPDFPTGGIIHGRGGIIQAYTTGKGAVRVRARADIEEGKKKDRIIVTEIPYMVNKARLITAIADLVKDKKIEGISNIRDESDRRGMRIVIELKSGAAGEIVLNQLYKHTQMQTTFGVINLSLVDNKPEVLTLKQTIIHFINHRKDVITRRCEFELDKAQKRVHILEGLRIALENIDDVVKTIRASRSPEEAKASLIGRFELSEEQSQAILDMRLQKLTGLEREKIDEEYKGLLQTIAWLQEVLADEMKVLGLIKEELAEIKEKYGDERRTEIVEGEIDMDIEDLIAEENMVVTITNQGYIKRLPVETYRAQRRGGKGMIGTSTKEEDFVEDLFVASTHDYVLFFTDSGQVHWLKVYQIPEASRYARGTAIVNLLQIAPETKITAAIKVSEFRDDLFLVAATKEGLVKKTELSQYSRPRRGGIIGINLREGDQLVSVSLTSGEDHIILSTRDGKAIRFKETDARPLGRASQGVRGVRLKGGDELVGMVVVDPESTLLTITENGYGKRTVFGKYPVQNRGGQGVIDIKTTDRNGKVVAIKAVKPGDDIMTVTSNGVVIRMSSDGISEIGRNTQGVRIMRLNEGNKVVSVAKIVKEDEEPTEAEPMFKEVSDKPEASEPGETEAVEEAPSEEGYPEPEEESEEESEEKPRDYIDTDLEFEEADEGDEDSEEESEGESGSEESEEEEEEEEEETEKKPDESNPFKEIGYI